eukprot:TRINITY_DN1902_c1_g1_i1.p1 TRINITY_DN1902_c1_g1~~TRINITY_DN1902_c1_g1_i1.p1  ORF type:complete len:2154 (-),score=847.63 TRINITY_DN1902_c1_g1_i1:92-6553(-)
MADEAARSTAYAYKTISNLVLQSERSRTSSEPTGEVESLKGKLAGRMGDRVARERPRELDEKLDKMKKRKTDTKEKEKSAPDRAKRGRDVLAATDNLDLTYRPKTKETKLAYDQILAFIQARLGYQPQDVLRSAGDEILAIIKSDSTRAPDKKLECEKILNTLPTEDFAQLTALVKRISDYTEEADKTQTQSNLDDENGVAVVFDEEEEGSDYDEINDESDEEYDDDAVTTSTSITTEDEEGEGSAILRTTDDDDMMDDGVRKSRGRDPYDLNPRDIDAFFLQRRVALFEPDPVLAQQLAENVFQVLADADEGQAENELVLLLGFDQFETVKLLLRNRFKIVYCVKLARASNDQEREALETEMRSNPELKGVLQELKGERSSKTQAKGKAKAAAAGAAKGEKGAAPKSMLDLESLSFNQGGHLMSNKQCKLPPGSYRKTKKGYEEVFIPGLKHPPFAADEKLVEIKSLPEWSHGAFKGMETLNRVQSRLHQAALFGAENLLLCAPTGAGKTNVAMLTMMHEIGLHIYNGVVDKEAFKIVYIAPMKSLVAEMVGNFSKRLGDGTPYGLTVRELTGDQSLSKKQISETQIIVTTPEKWDIITRKSGDRTYTELVRLIIIDEIHLLHDDRGPVLEGIVARTLRQIEATQVMVRLVGLSATLPNYEDVATLLRVQPSGLFAFDNSYRPVPLEQQYIGITEKKGLRRFQLMNEITYEKVMERAGKSQVLVFVHGRKETAKTARSIRDMALANDALDKFLGATGGTRVVLQTEAEKTAQNADLKELLPYGFAIHHAGMSRSDRTLVEDLFADGYIQVLVSTATLAWGVNLPAHTVIIKGTQVYSPEKGDWTELSPLDVMQMLGRAGRPAFDTTGEGIVITSHGELQYYLSLLNQQLPIESQLIGKLPDILNAEIVLGTIQTVKDAVNWLGYTYLYICMLRNPALYGIGADEPEEDPLLEQRRIDLIHTAASLLDKNNLIKYDRKGGAFQVTDLGRVASHYYITSQSMAIYNEHLKPSMTDIDIFRLFSLSSEFKQVNVRGEEKIELEKLLERVPIPVKESLEEPSAKINVLLQTYISKLKLDGLALISDMVYVTQSAGRIIRALFEVVLKRGWAQLALRLLQVAKMVDRRMWGSLTPLRQFKDLPEELLKRLEKKEFPMERLFDLDSQALGELVHYPQQGKNLHQHIHQFPRLDLAAYVQPITRSILRVELTITPDFNYVEKYHGNALPFFIIVEDVDGEQVLHHEYFLLKKKFAGEEHRVSFTVPLYDPLPPQYFIRVVSDRWLGCESVVAVSFRHLILPEKYPPHTELLDLQPLPVTALKDAKAEKLYSFKYFNPIQTQVFPAAFNSDDNLLLAAPPGSGKTVAAEFALLRMFQQAYEGRSRAVYVAPMQAIATERYRDWSRKFGEGMGKTVVELTGDTAADLKLLEQGDIIITTAEIWDVLSRRWKQRKNIKTLRLFIVDELHLIGGTKGPTLEVVCSRMRYIAAQTGTPIRIVALSSSLANARDLGEWIGTTHHSLFNFHPNVRPIPLEIHMQGFDIPHFASRMLAMSKPTVNAVIQHARGKPAIVFVPTRKQTRKTAQDLITFTDASDIVQEGVAPVRRFLRVTEADLAPYLEEIESKALRESLSFGVGFLHEGLTAKERRIVETLFRSGAITALVATYDLSWGMDLSAYLVVIMGTQYYQGKEQGYGDYNITDILQMMGRAGRPVVDDQGKCVIFCHAPKKDYYKKFLYEPLPVESHLDQFLADHFNSEIVTQTIVDKQDAIDYLTWTFLYRRFTQNPNYYNLTGVSNRHLSDHMSELVETTISDLEQAKCIAVENDIDVVPLNLGMIAAYYYIQYTTTELFSSSLTGSTKLKGLVDIMAMASELNDLPMRHSEDTVLQRLAAHLPMKIDKPKYNDPHTKALVLLQAHFSRRALSADLHQDQMIVVETASRLLLAMVDVISSNSWLRPALAAMELSQMVTQAVWDTDSVLKQLPHMTDDRINRLKAKGIENILDLMDMDDVDRVKLLGMSEREMSEVAEVCNTYPLNIELQYAVQDEDALHAGSQVVVIVDLERQLDEDQDISSVHAPFYPKQRSEGWWVVVGDTKTNQLLAIKRVNLARKSQVKLDFTAPSPGSYNYTLSFMSDSYMGCDQEYELALDVKPARIDDDQEMEG